MRLGFLTIIVSLVFSFPSWAQPNCVDEKACQSQLLRFEVASSVLQGAGDNLLPLLNQMAQSQTITELIQKPRAISSINLPHNMANCEREKAASNPLFATIDCHGGNLCGRPELNPEVRGLICFQLPCPIFEGTLNPGKCGEVTSVFPTRVDFPTPLAIENARIVPTKVEYNAPAVKICLRIEELSLRSSVRLELDVSRTQLPDSGITLNNLNPRLDGPRNVCISANVNLASASASAVSELKIETMDNTPFISDEMIRATSRGLELSGLSGYPEAELERIKGEIVPVIVQPLRDSVESALKSSLAQVFETELNRLSRHEGIQGSQGFLVNTENLLSNVGLGNLRFRENLARTQCRGLAEARRPIPENHPCRSIPDFKDEIDRPLFGLGQYWELKELLKQGSQLNLTSESLKQELIALKDLMRAKVDPNNDPADLSDFAESGRARWREAIEEDIRTYVDPIIDRISRNQLEGHVASFIQIQDMLQGNLGRNVGVSVPDICSDTNPSPHARRSIPNCPVQAYVDLNELNTLFNRMWSEGTLCQTGRGPYTPSAEEFDERGIPNGSGCTIEYGGMRCYLNSSPSIQWDQRNRRYKMAVNLRACHRHGMIFGIGRFGGDFNLDMNFIPKVCDNGDFCLGRTSSSVRVVPGSERFDLVPGSSLRTRIVNTLKTSINTALSDSLRIPLASSLETASPLALEPDGRVDTGAGFFGACLRPSGISGQ